MDPKKDALAAIWTTLSDNTKRIKYDLPLTTNRIENFEHDEIAEHARDSYPIVHRRVADLMMKFLSLKRGPYGSKIERELYAKMTVPQFMTRLLTCRPLAFLNPSVSHTKANLLSSHATTVCRSF